MRTEKDFIGEQLIPGEALYGIHSVRARENFPDKTVFFKEWYQAVGLVKLACYNAYSKFKAAAETENPNLPFNFMDNEVLELLKKSAEEVASGIHFEFFIVPAVQGGAGTSINMNVNEIIANRSLQLMGKLPGEYHIIDPIEQANIFQSTNDVIPTSLKVAVMQLLTSLENAINTTRQDTESLEQKHREHLRTGYTQMQEAVPSSYGRLFSTYSEALSRDWWRVSKCSERIKITNLGGGAIGSGIAIPRFYIMQVSRELQELTNLPLTRGENLQDATSNNDSLVEVHAILKSHAVNLEKIVSDLRLLASDLSHKELDIPEKQVGSSIMPGKVNPVIPEFIISACHKIYANDMVITSLCAQGCLELNAYLPLIGHSMIESLKLLIACNESFHKHLLTGLTVRHETAVRRLYMSPSVSTALIPYIGYHKAAALAREMKKSGTDIFQANNALQLIEIEKLQEILKPEHLLKLGYSIKDLQ